MDELTGGRSRQIEPRRRGAFDRRGRGNRWNRPGPVLGALDLGTNNCRLLIARPARDGGFTVIDGYSRIVRLGEGMTSTGSLSPQAMNRAIDALKVCTEKLERRHVTHGRYVATQACRAAANSEIFIGRVQEEAGLRLEAISSREEAQLTLTGCLPLLDPSVDHALVFDVGGGSIEIVWLWLGAGSLPRILGWMSCPIGVVTLTERNGGHDFTPEAYERTVREIEDLMEPFERAHRIRGQMFAGRVQMLGTAGTVTTVAAVKMGLKRYNRSLVDGSYLDFSDIKEVCCDLAGSTFAERSANPCVGAARADLVVAGCAVLEAVCRVWPVGRMRVADRGVREGILTDLVTGLRGAEDTVAP